MKPVDVHCFAEKILTRLSCRADDQTLSFLNLTKTMKSGWKCFRGMR